jgi:hypothetical protein
VNRGGLWSVASRVDRLWGECYGFVPLGGSMKPAFTLSLALLLSFFALAARAQDKPTSKPAAKTASVLDKRIEIDCKATLDGQPVKPNGLQYFLYERFNKFYLRVDSKVKVIGHKDYDKYIGRMTRYWKKKDPENKQPVDLKLVVVQTVKYDASKFYGQAQVHNYHGEIKAVLSAGDGTAIATFEFPLKWGRLISSGLTKAQVQQRYDQMVHTALAAAVLNHPRVRNLVPKLKKTKRGTYKIRKRLKSWSKQKRTELLEVLEGGTEVMKKGKMANFVRAIRLEGEEPPKKDPKKAPEKAPEKSKK